jgi:hypothetical protein
MQDNEASRSVSPFLRSGSRHPSVQERMKNFARKKLFTPHKMITRSKSKGGSLSTLPESDYLDRKKRRRRRRSNITPAKLDFELLKDTLASLQESKAAVQSEAPKEEDPEKAYNSNVTQWAQGIENVPYSQDEEVPAFPIRC